MWTLEGIDWDTGEVAMTVETTAFPMSNSFYAATTIGPDGTAWTGNFGGVTRFHPCDPDQEPDCGRRLDPVEAIGTIPADPEDALQDTLGLPNDQSSERDDVPNGGPADGTGDGGGDDDADDGNVATGDSDDDQPLASTGGGTGLLGLAGLLALARRGRR